MALFKAPVNDMRFVESSSLSIEAFLPLGSVVMPMSGKYRGCKGVVTAHCSPSAASASSAAVANDREKEEEVEVEFDQISVEAPFGYNIAASIGVQHYSARDVCLALQISSFSFYFDFIMHAVNFASFNEQALSCWVG